MSTANEAGNDGWSAIARDGRWTAWSGLPAGLRLEDALAALGVVELPWPEPARLGRRTLDRSQAGGLRVWSEGGAVVMIEWIDPPSATSVASLVESLGAPDRDAAGRHLREGASTTEKVYATRGLAVTIAESYDSPPTFEPRLAAVQLFAPTDLQGFIVELGGADQPGPRPIGPGPR